MGGITSSFWIYKVEDACKISKWRLQMSICGCQGEDKGVSQS